MATLTDAQIAGLAKGVGLSGDALIKSVAIALAESGGRSDVLGPPTVYGRAVGVWQIMPLVGRPSTARLKDVNVNAQQMYKISNGGKNWRPWEAYTNGSYLRFVSRARKAAGAPSTSIPSQGIEQAGFDLNPFDEIGAFFDFITDPKTWLRLGLILAGGALLITALVKVSGAGGVAKDIADTVTDVIPQTRGAKAAAKAAG